jgi:hypothetical protein
VTSTGSYPGRVTVRAALEGHQYDLQTLAELFPEGEPRVARDNKDGRYYLESSELDPHFRDGGRMLDLAKEILDELVAVARLQPEEFHDVSLAGQFDRPTADGERETSGHLSDSWAWRDRATVVRVEASEARAHVHAVASATHPDEAITEPAAPRGLRYLRLARSHPEVKELLRLLGTSDMSW